MDAAPRFAAADAREKRLIFIDALRVSAILFVIIHHAAQAYGPTRGFWLVHDRAQSEWFAPFYTANSAFGMGLMFLLAGYFVPPSCERKGARRFLRERWTRIGVPLVGLVLLVHLPAAYLISGRPPLPDFIHALYERGWLPIYLHLWFVAHLLVYSAAYVVWRVVLVRSRQAQSSQSPPGHIVIIGFVLALALITFLVRIWYPIDRWVSFLWIMPVEPAHVPQYMALFAAGVAAFRGDWFRSMPTGAGVACLAIGMIASSGIYLAYAFGSWNELMASGGFNLSSLIRSFWETVIAVCLSIGLIVAFRELFDRPSRLFSVMAAASFGAYILHPAIVVTLQEAITDLAMPAFAKFAVVSLLGSLLSFALARLSGHVPGVRLVLGTAPPDMPPLSSANLRLETPSLQPVANFQRKPPAAG
jgi:glucan biosynthesis protein C